MRTQPTGLPLRLEDAEVFEGHGLLAKSTAPSPGMPAVSQPSSHMIIRQAPNGEVRTHESRSPFDRADALRQLQLALGVDVPPQLAPVPPSMPTSFTPAAAGSASHAPCVLHVTRCQVVSSPDMAVDQLLVLREECDALTRWIRRSLDDATAVNERLALPGAPSTPSCARQALCSVASVTELLARAKGLERARRCWPNTCDEFNRLVRTALRQEVPTTSRTETTSAICANALRDTVKTIGVMHNIENHMWRLAPLLERFRRLEPALSEAARKQESFTSVADITSSECFAGLQTLTSDVARFAEEMTVAAARMAANHAALRSRVEALRANSSPGTVA